MKHRGRNLSRAFHHYCGKRKKMPQILVHPLRKNLQLFLFSCSCHFKSKWAGLSRECMASKAWRVLQFMPVIIVESTPATSWWRIKCVTHGHQGCKKFIKRPKHFAFRPVYETPVLINSPKSILEPWTTSLYSYYVWKTFSHLWWHIKYTAD